MLLKIRNEIIMGQNNPKSGKPNSGKPNDRNPKGRRLNEKLDSYMKDAVENFAWLDILSTKAGIASLEFQNIGDHWILLEKLENLLRNFTKLYREQGQIDPLTYEDFADRLQDTIDELRLGLGYGSYSMEDQAQTANETQLELEFRAPFHNHK